MSTQDQQRIYLAEELGWSHVITDPWLGTNPSGNMDKPVPTLEELIPIRDRT